MTPTSATTQAAQDLILGGLRKIGKYTTGQPLDLTIGSSCLQTLNDLMDSLSNDNLLCYAAIENILYFTANVQQYTVGNPQSSTTVTGTFTSGSPIITNVLPGIPTGLVAGTSGTAGSGVNQVASTLADVQVFFPVGTYVTAFNTTTRTITMSANATAAAGAGTAENFYYTTPGLFGIPWPINPIGGFTRISGTGGAGISTGLDYYIDVKSKEEWIQIGYKGVPGPWPTAMYCDMTFPLGNLYFYPNPSQAGELHLWTDILLTGFPLLTSAFLMPPGYARFLKLALALEFWPEFRKAEEEPTWLTKQYLQARSLLEAKNQKKQNVASYDRNLPRSRQNDASWIFDGGFNR